MSAHVSHTHQTVPVPSVYCDQDIINLVLILKSVKLKINFELVYVLLSYDVCLIVCFGQVWKSLCFANILAYINFYTLCILSIKY